MGSRSHPNLFVINAILRRHFPAAIIRWNTENDPFVIEVSVGEDWVKAVIPVEDLEEGGEVYHKFIGKLLEYLKKSRKEPGDTSARAGVEVILAEAA